MLERIVRNKSFSKRATIGCFSLCIVGLTLLAGCSQNPAGGVGITPAPTSPLMDQIWQPPEPQKQVQQAQPTAIVDSPDALLIYESISLGGSDSLKITTSGEAIVEGNQGKFTTYTLSANEFSQIRQAITDTNFFNLQDRYWKIDPPGVIAEIPIIEITYKEYGHFKTVSIRGTNESPTALETLASTLYHLIDKVRKEGAAITHPMLLVGYYLQGSKNQTWSFDIDVEGGTYYSSGLPNANLSTEDLKALNDALDAISDLGSDQWYAAPDSIRDTIYMDEHRAIVTTSSQPTQDLNATSGGDVPKSLDATLRLLATIYDKYAP